MHRAVSFLSGFLSKFDYGDPDHNLVAFSPEDRWTQREESEELDSSNSSSGLCGTRTVQHPGTVAHPMESGVTVAHSCLVAGRRSRADITPCQSPQGSRLNSAFLSRCVISEL